MGEQMKSSKDAIWHVRLRQSWADIKKDNIPDRVERARVSTIIAPIVSTSI